MALGTQISLGAKFWPNRNGRGEHALVICRGMPHILIGIATTGCPESSLTGSYEATAGPQLLQTGRKADTQVLSGLQDDSSSDNEKNIRPNTGQKASEIETLLKST